MRAGQACDHRIGQRRGRTGTPSRSGARVRVLVHSHGPPAIGNLFVLGALVGFGVLGLLASEPLSDTRPIERGTDRIVAGCSIGPLSDLSAPSRCSRRSTAP
jgi:hypothetical protein